MRRAERDQIYTVKVKTDKFSTKFEDWIEKDLLKLNAFDIRQVGLNDYSTADNLTVDGVSLMVKKRSKIELGFDDAKSSWNLIEMTEFDDKGEPVPVTLGEDEELNNEKLNALKTALDDLKIVDVQRKPKGLSQESEGQRRVGQGQRSGPVARAAWVFPRRRKPRNLFERRRSHLHDQRGSAVYAALRPSGRRRRNQGRQGIAR